MPAHRVPRVQLFCAIPTCGNPFEVTPGEKDRRRYCSPACRRLALQERMTKEPVTLLCAYAPCSNPFEVIPHQATIWKYCSPACYHLARTTHTYEAFTARFWKKVRICAHGRTCTTCCWIWMGAVHGLDGYGNFRATPYKSGNVSAHIVSWFIAHDAVWPEEGLFVLHSCDMPPCVAPHHLSTGTPLENVQDMVSKGRKPRGDLSTSHKITEAQVEEAAHLHATGQCNFNQLAKRYGVTRMAVVHRVQKYNANRA